MTGPERIWAMQDRCGTWDTGTFCGVNDGGTEYVRADLMQAEIARLTAERDAALAGAVKPLVWIDNPDQALDCWMVDDFGLYQITDELVLFAGHESTGRKFDTLVAAKAAAQADYEARILAAIQTDTEAVERATDAAYTEGFEHGERSDLRVENERMREALTLLATCTPRIDISADDFLREFVHPTARAALQPEVRE